MIQLTKINNDADHTSYEFDLSADTYYVTSDDMPLSEFCDDPNQIVTITVHLELEPDRDFSGDIVCESCETPSAPYYWLHEYYGLHSCLSHLLPATQTEILNIIKTL